MVKNGWIRFNGLYLDNIKIINKSRDVKEIEMIHTSTTLHMCVLCYVRKIYKHQKIRERERERERERR